MPKDMRPILAEKRICFRCGKRIPKHRQKRAKTCSVQCSNYYNRKDHGWRVKNANKIFSKILIASKGEKRGTIKYKEV